MTSDKATVGPAARSSTRRQQSMNYLSTSQWQQHENLAGIASIVLWCVMVTIGLLVFIVKRRKRENNQLASTSTKADAEAVALQSVDVALLKISSLVQQDKKKTARYADVELLLDVAHTYDSEEVVSTNERLEEAVMRIQRAKELLQANNSYGKSDVGGSRSSFLVESKKTNRSGRGTMLCTTEFV